MSTIPPQHNYERMVVFSNRNHNISPNDIINFTIAPSGDNNYFLLNKSHMTLKLKLTGIPKNDSGATKSFYVPVKKCMSGIINNTKVTYTYFKEDGSLATLPLNADNENVGQIRSILNHMTQNKDLHKSGEMLKELSYDYYHDAQYGSTYDLIVNNTKETAMYLERPCDGKLFFNYLKFTQAPATTEAYTTINIAFSDIFEGCGAERFINLTQMDCECILQDKTSYFYINGNTITIAESFNTNETTIVHTGVYIDSCYVWTHSYKVNDSDEFDPEDTQLAKNQIMTKAFTIPKNQNYIDDRVICNFPIKMAYIMFTNLDNDFSNLIDIKFKKIALNIAGEQKRYIDVDNNNNPDGKDRLLFEWMDYICNDHGDEYTTFLDYKSWRDQFKVYAFPMSEWFPMRASNQVQFEIEFEGNNTEGVKMHMVMIRAGEY